MKRRGVLGIVVGVTLISVAGCLSDDEDAADSFTGDIDNQFGVDEWTREDGRLTIRYETSGSLNHDLETIALEYANLVDDGFDEDLRATGYGASNEITIEISNDLASQYNAGEISESEYLDSAVK